MLIVYKVVMFLFMSISMFFGYLLAFKNKITLINFYKPGTYPAITENKLCKSHGYSLIVIGIIGFISIYYYWMSFFVIFPIVYQVFNHKKIIKEAKSL